MFDPGIGVVGITATDGSISSRLLGQPSHRSHLTQRTIWSSILRRTTAALSNIPPRPDGALGLRVVAPDAAIAALIRGPIEEGKGRGGSSREAGGGFAPNPWPDGASGAKGKGCVGCPAKPRS